MRHPPARRLLSVARMAPSSSLRLLLWARDFSLVGAACGFLAPFAYFAGQHPRYALATGLGGMAAGAALGPLSGALISLARRRLPKIAVISFGLVLGALWGGLSGAAPELFGHERFWLYSLERSVGTSAAAGAALGWWFWLAYSYRRLNHRSIWPVVLGGCAAAPALGFVAFLALYSECSPQFFASGLALLVVPLGVLLGRRLLGRGFARGDGGSMGTRM